MTKKCKSIKDILEKITNIEHRIMILKSKNKNPKPVVCEAELS